MGAVKVADAYAYACEQYEKAMNIVAEMSSALKPGKTGFTFDVAAREFDYVLQCVLFTAAVQDGNFHPKELKFIKQLTERGDVLDLVNARCDSSIEWRELSSYGEEELLSFVRSVELSIRRYVQEFVKNFSALDAASPIDYLGRLDECLASIVCAFSATDGDKLSEAASDLEITAALRRYFDLFSRRWISFVRTAEKASAAPTSAAQLSFPELNDKTSSANYLSSPDAFLRSVIYVEAGTRTGSGVIITSSGYALTCAHVAKTCKELLVKVTNRCGEGELFAATPIAIHPTEDLALVKIQGWDFDCAEVDVDAALPALGTEVALFGYPFGSAVSDSVSDLNVSLAKGYVSSNQTLKGVKKTFLDVAALSGNSGGPVVSLSTGKVIGILTGSIRGRAREEVNYMLPISYLKTVL